LVYDKTPTRRALEPGGLDRVKRRLAAIVAAVVSGYSWLIEADEEGTLPGSGRSVPS
jgi:hypothetical protein